MASTTKGLRYGSPDRRPLGSASAHVARLAQDVGSARESHDPALRADPSDGPVWNTIEISLGRRFEPVSIPADLVIRLSHRRAGARTVSDVPYLLRRRPSAAACRARGEPSDGYPVRRGRHAPAGSRWTVAHAGPARGQAAPTQRVPMSCSPSATRAWAASRERAMSKKNRARQRAARGARERQASGTRPHGETLIPMPRHLLRSSRRLDTSATASSTGAGTARLSRRLCSSTGVCGSSTFRVLGTAGFQARCRMVKAICFCVRVAPRTVLAHAAGRRHRPRPLHHPSNFAANRTGVRTPAGHVPGGVPLHYRRWLYDNDPDPMNAWLDQRLTDTVFEPGV